MIPEGKGSVVNDNSVLREDCCGVRVTRFVFRWALRGTVCYDYQHALFVKTNL